MYQTSPSKLLSVRDDLAAFLLDRAVAHFGTAVDADIDKAQDGKQGRAAEAAANGAIARWLDDGTETAPKRQFRTPTATM